MSLPHKWQRGKHPATLTGWVGPHTWGERSFYWGISLLDCLYLTVGQPGLGQGPARDPGMQRNEQLVRWPNRPGTCDVQRQSSNHFRASRCWAASRSKPSIGTDCSLTDWERWKSIFQSWIGLPRTQISTLLKQRRIISTENGQKEAKIQTTALNILQDVWKTIPQDILNKVVKAA